MNSAEKKIILKVVEYVNKSTNKWNMKQISEIIQKLHPKKYLEQNKKCVKL